MSYRFLFGFGSLFSALMAVAIFFLPAFQPSVTDILALAAVAALITLARPSPARVRAFRERLMNRPDFISDGSTA